MSMTKSCVMRAELNRPEGPIFPGGGTSPPRFAVESDLTVYSRFSCNRVTTMAVRRRTVVTAHIIVFVLMQPAVMIPGITQGGVETTPFSTIQPKFKRIVIRTAQRNLSTCNENG